jgi:hypothetical protein
MKITATKSGLQICLVKEFVNEGATRNRSVKEKRSNALNEIWKHDFIKQQVLPASLLLKTCTTKARLYLIAQHSPD